MDIKNNEVKEYYGKTLKTTSDLKTDACCTVLNYSKEIKDILSQVHDEVLIKYYGCGLTIPTELEGLNVLDLGSGSGRDCFILSKLVGESGSVLGVDMTDEQLDVANKHIEYHREKFGYKESNVSFKKAYIEKLGELGLKNGSLDLIVSNCVINLATDKEAVLKDAFSLLKEGGEMYFSDIYASRRVPDELVKDEVLYGECLSGALYWNDFENLAKKAGFVDPRVVESRRLSIDNEELQKKIEGIEFYSVTYRLFKLSDLEPDCEDYGQAVIYNGSLKEDSKKFILDGHHVFQKGKVELVCGNSFLMLQKTRFKEHFTFIGDFSTHYGIFPGCGATIPYEESKNESDDLACC